MKVLETEHRRVLPAALREFECNRNNLDRWRSNHVSRNVIRALNSVTQAGKIPASTSASRLYDSGSAPAAFDSTSRYVRFLPVLEGVQGPK